jgi:hypothetical protein
MPRKPRQHDYALNGRLKEERHTPVAANATIAIGSSGSSRPSRLEVNWLMIRDPADVAREKKLVLRTSIKAGFRNGSVGLRFQR